MSDNVSEVFESLRRSYESDRLAHAYVIIGPEPVTVQLTDQLLGLLFCPGERKPCGECQVCHLLEGRTHPDVLWVEPESKSRVIKTEQVRDLNKRMASTSYAGGWKVGVILHADRLFANAANAFLKTLEEPPQRSLLLLLTDLPQALLPTVVSRCQRVVLSGGEGDASETWRPALMELLSRFPPPDPLEAMAQSGAFKAIMDGVKKEVEKSETESADGDLDDKVLLARISARVNEVRAEILRVVMCWRRDVLVLCAGADEERVHFPAHIDALRRQAQNLSVGDALAQVTAVEGMKRQFDRNMPDLAVFERDQIQALA